MNQLLASLQISTQVVWGTSDEELAQQVQKAQVHGWAWDGNVYWRRTVASKICVAVLVSLNAIRAVESGPRLPLTRV